MAGLPFARPLFRTRDAALVVARLAASRHAVAGVVVGVLLRSLWAAQTMRAATAEARRIEAEARTRQKELILEAKDEKLRMQREAEEEARARRAEGGVFPGMSRVRVLLTASLVLVWSMPPVVAVQVWNWMTNSQNGVVNYVLTELHAGDYFQHNWYETTFSQLSLVTALIVWGALPFVAITVYAALSQVPRELIEAAEIDGARSWRGFRDVTVPIIMPGLLILTSLSIIWDFGVFTQPYLLIGQGHVVPDNYLMGIYLFEEGYVRTDFGRGAAISILMLAIVAAMSVVYVRRMLRVGEVE